MRELNTTDVIRILDNVSFESPLSDDTMIDIISCILQNKEIKATGANHSNDYDRAEFPTLEQIQLVAEYAIAIKAIYEVIIYFSKRPEFNEALEHITKHAERAFKYLDERDLHELIQAILDWVWPR